MKSEVVVTPSGRMRVTAAALFIPSLIALWVALRGWADPGVLVPSLGATVVLAFPAIFLCESEGYLTRWRAFEDGIERMTPFRRGIYVPWAEVWRVGEGVKGTLFIEYMPGRTIVLAHDLVGWDALCLEVLARAPASAITDEMRVRLADRMRLRASELASLATGVPIDLPEPAVPRDDAASRWRDNPFLVLELSPECSRADVERVGQKLLALLAVGSGAAKHFATPLGEAPRTPEGVRLAMSELRDPERRLLHELWAHAGAQPIAKVLPIEAALDPARPWPHAIAAIGMGCLPPDGDEVETKGKRT